MLDFEDIINSRTAGTIYSKASTEAGRVLSKLDPPYRQAAGDVLNAFLPGFGGGVSPYGDNTYSQILQRKKIQSDQELATTAQQVGGYVTNGGLSQSFDWRARLRPKKGGESRFYASKDQEEYLLRPIQESGGLVWQYTPNIYIQGQVQYNEAMMQGMNYPINTYNYSRASELTVSADFTANDIYEARYMLALMVFLRIATKSEFGDRSGEQAGTPPPVMLFEYLGDHGFNKVPVVISNYALQLDSEIDYVPVEVQGAGEASTITYVPTMANLVLTLLPQYTPHKLRRKFSVEDVANGKAYKDGFI